MHAHLLATAKSAVLSLHGVLHRICNLPDSFLYLIHTDESVHIAKNVVKRTVLRNIFLYVAFLDNGSVNSAAYERSEDILRLGDGFVGKAEGLILGFHPILEVCLQFLLSLRGIACDAILHLELAAAYLIKFHKARCGQVELIFESVCNGRVIVEEVIESARETRNHHDGVVFPMIHLNKKLVKRVHLVGIPVGKQFLDIVEKENATLGFFYIFIPFVNKPLVVNGVNHC